MKQERISNIIIPSKFHYLSTLEIIDMRFNLLLKYISYQSDKIARGDKNIGTFDQWLCRNRYSSLVI